MCTEGPLLLGLRLSCPSPLVAHAHTCMHAHAHMHTHRQQVASLQGGCIYSGQQSTLYSCPKEGETGAIRCPGASRTSPAGEVMTEGPLCRGDTASKAGRQRPERANLHPSGGEGWGHFGDKISWGNGPQTLLFPLRKGQCTGMRGGRLSRALESLVTPTPNFPLR